ncbi:hypothetical protein [Halalkalicoccus subterraneus]|uniref:hypothetical protein n=1 Tax=Halalkalicoccus subterraneus TaxID=2675002 RepID=UPI000EFC6A22|nr:hypothetical protein [Halalkalicoccus subterraneus]
MGEKKTLFEINVENFEFSPSPRFGNELAEAVDGIEGKGSKLGLFGSKEAAEETTDDEDESSGLFSRTTDEDTEELDELDEADEAPTEVEVEDEEVDGEESGSALGLVIGLLFLLVVAAATKKFATSDVAEDYEEVELSEYEN